MTFFLCVKMRLGVVEPCQVIKLSRKVGLMSKNNKITEKKKTKNFNKVKCCKVSAYFMGY